MKHHAPNNPSAHGGHPAHPAHPAHANAHHHPAHHFGFAHPHAEVFVPGGGDPAAALSLVTHLGIGAHADDLEFMAYHGIAACYGQPDKRFGGVTVTDGAGSPRGKSSAGLSPEALVQTRVREQRAAALAGDYAIQIQLGHPSSAVKAGDAAVDEDLDSILRACRPHTVYLHNPADKHDTHVALLLRCLEAFRRLPQDRRPAKVYGCEVWRGLDWAPDGARAALPCAERPHLAAALAGVFDSQIHGAKRYDLAVAGRRAANATFSESHHADTATALTWALDLTEVVHHETVTIEAYLDAILEQFTQDVLSRLRRFARTP